MKPTLAKADYHFCINAPRLKPWVNKEQIKLTQAFRLEQKINSIGSSQSELKIA
jgi:hypothetical protein